MDKIISNNFSEENINYKILDNIRDSFYCLDFKGNFIYLNKASEKLIGRTAEELLGQNLWEIDSQILDTKFYTEFNRAIDEKKPVFFEEFYKNKYYQVHAYPFLSNLTVYFRDITLEKQLKNLNINYSEQLELSLNTLKKLMDNSFDIICTFDHQGLLLTANNAFEKFFGYKAEEFIGKNLSEFIYSDDIDETLSILEVSNINGFENKCLKKNGSVGYINWSSYWSDDEKIFVIIAQDITEKKLAEDKLLKDEAFYRLLIENSTDVLVLADKNWKRTYVSPSIYTTLGYTQDEFLSYDLKMLLHPEDLEYTLQSFNYILQNPDVVLVSQFRMKNKNGDWRYMEGTTKNMLNHPDIQSIVITRRDVTVSKEKEEKIKAQAALLDKSKDAIMVYDLDWNITFWNDSAEKLYGWKREDVIGKSAKSLYKNQDDIIDIYNFILKNGEYSKEITKITKDKRQIIIKSNKTLVYDDAHKPESILVINTDITDKKEMENQFFRAQRLESLGTLASGIAHDLNNALTPILMGVEILKTKLTDEKSIRVLKNIQSSTIHASEMVKQVLTFAKGSNGKTEVLNLTMLLKSIEKIISDTFPKNIDIKFDINDNLWNIKADTTQIHQVIMNVCVNSKDALPNGGLIKLKAENILIDKNYAKMHHAFKPGLYNMIEVYDSGTGIPKDIIDRVFEPFFTSKPVGKGTGLGLSTSLSIIKSHNGFINIYSEAGNGTKVKIYLPASDSLEFQEADKQENNILKGNNELILVIDDEQSILDMTKETLTSFGYRVITASDGTEGITEYLKNINDISLVITDMIMPYMDGLATIRALLKINPQLKIIAASGFETNEKISHAVELGISLFLVKPYLTEKLLKSIKEVIDN